jgi:hypothetical protein
MSIVPATSFYLEEIRLRSFQFYRVEQISLKSSEIEVLMKSLMLFCLIVLAACASHKDVRPGEDGVHRVVVRGYEKSSVERSAIKQANRFCKKSDKYAAFISENTKYTGSMEEKTHNTVKKVSRAATVGGGMMGVMGGAAESSIGEGIFGAGVVGQAFLDDDAYTADMKFKCK